VDPPNLKLVTRGGRRNIALEYAALSYCWGKTQTFTLTASSHSSWLSSIPYNELPQTIKDAILATSELGLRYLWIDALCIIQDDNEEKAKEIRQMADIYKHSYVTIAASKAKSVDEGFLWWPKLELFRIAYECSDGETGSVLFSPELGENMLFSPEPLDKRGWALQEELLAPRRIDFGTYQLRWTCLETVGTRDVVDGWLNFKATNSHFYSHQALPRFQSRPESRDWQHIIQVYTERKRSDPYDKLLAISAIARRYGELTEDVYLAGLWRSTFVEELQWEIVELEDSSDHDTTTYLAPSWSWASVDCPIVYMIGTALGTQPELTILEVKLQTLPSSDPYAIVCGGFVRIQGPCCDFVVGEDSKFESVDDCKRLVNIAPGLSMFGKTNTVPGDHVLLLLLSVNGSYPSPMEEGFCLVLKSADGEHYTRTGSVRIGGPSSDPPSRFEYRKEEWPQRTVIIK
jgi:hypothetical protein